METIKLKPCHCGKQPIIIKTRNKCTIKCANGVCEEEVEINNPYHTKHLKIFVEERARVMWNNMIEKGTF